MPLPDVRISARAADRLLAGHPWVWRSDVTGTPTLEPGGLVRVHGPTGAGRRNAPLGVAMASTRSEIMLRMVDAPGLPPPAGDVLDVAFFTGRLETARTMRRRAFGGTLPQAWRWLHGESDGVPGVVMDVLGDRVAVQVLAQGSHAAQAALLEATWQLARPASIILRNDVPSRAREGLPLHKETWRGEGTSVTYREGDVALQVDLLAGQKTGTFLDQQENHVLAGTLARGRALDVCSGDGGFALQMAKRAEHVTAVEMSASACERIRHNAALNGFANVETVEADAFEKLRAMDAAGERFDTVVVDPPAFAKGRAHVDGAFRGYKELNLRALRMLRPGGTLVTCSCSQPVDEEMFDVMLREAARDAKRDVQVLMRRGAGPDHPVRLGFPESRYLKCVVLGVA